eukprot:4079256-Karenia_brevis.AAC.1
MHSGKYNASTPVPADEDVSNMEERINKKIQNFAVTVGLQIQDYSNKTAEVVTKVASDIDARLAPLEASSREQNQSGTFQANIPGFDVALYDKLEKKVDAITATLTQHIAS